MSASFLERCLNLGDYENDGGAIDTVDLHSHLVLYEAGLCTAANIYFRYSCTEAQENDVDAILATMPGTILSALNAVARARWAGVIFHVLKLGLQGHPSYDSVAEVETALGI